MFENKQLISKRKSLFFNLKTLCGVTDAHQINLQKITSSLKENFQRFWKDSLYNDNQTMNGNKLREYRKFKTIFGKEEYLKILKNKSQRSAMARLRLSAHRLHIETGRYLPHNIKLPPNERLCKYCSLNVCENEYHFLLICPFYVNERCLLLSNVQKTFPHTLSYNNEQLYPWLMQSLDSSIILHLSNYILISFEKRNKHIVSA